MIRAFALLASALAVGGCGSSGASSEAEPPATAGTPASPAPVIDLAAGTYRGASLGDTRKALFAALRPGTRLTQDEPWTPSDYADVELDGPTGVIVKGNRPKPFRGYAWPKAMVMFVSGRAAEIEVAEPGASTVEGVAIGDDLDEVKSAYPTFHCDMANEGTEYEPYPACSGRLGRIQVWIGGDPITVIAFTSDAVSMDAV